MKEVLQNAPLDLQSFRSEVKGMHFADRKFQCLAVRGKETVDMDILITPGNGDRKIMHPIGITSEPVTRIMKGNHFSNSDENLPK